MSRLPRVALLLSLCLASVPLLADTPKLPPGSGPALHPGETLRLEWERVPQDVEEFEILLSLDGGAHFAIRLTKDLEPETRHYVWRVPNLPTRSARLVLRMKRPPEGPGDDHERLGTPGALFEILPASTVSLEKPRSYKGDLALLASSPWEALPFASLGTPRRASPLDSEGLSVDGPKRPLASDRPSVPEEELEAATDLAGTVARDTPRDRGPLTVPLRR